LLLTEDAMSKAPSLTSRARFARTARIDTVEHLRSAPIARQWQHSRLVQAFQTQYAMTQDRQRAMGMLFGGMGYDRLPSSWDEGTEWCLRDEAAYLAEADLYVLTPQMCDVVTAAAQALTLEDLRLADAHDLPSPTGLLVLPHPLMVRAPNGEMSDDRAVHWRSPAFLPTPKRNEAVRVSLYSDTHGPVQPDTFRDFKDLALHQGTPLPPLLLNNIRLMPWHFEGDTEGLAELRDAARSVRQASEQVARQHGLDEERVIDFVPGSEIDDQLNTFTLRFCYAFWRLCEQEIATVEQLPTYRSEQRQADRAGVASDVRVVQLRRSDRTSNEPSGTREWRHRWIVRMHKVRQWYPSEQRHKIIYRGPYLKGPDGKPLIGGDVVRVLTRDT
jgi:hypothetical protein